MATLGQTADIGWGVTISWSGDTIDLISIDGPAPECDVVDKTHSASANQWREKIAGLKDAGEITAELNFAITQAPNFVTGESGTLTVSFDGAGTFSCSAFLRSFAVSVPLEDRMTAQATWALTGEPTWA